MLLQAGDPPLSCVLEAATLQPVPGGAYLGPAPLSALWGAPWRASGVVSQAALNQMTSLLLMVIVAWVVLMVLVGAVLVIMATAQKLASEKKEPLEGDEEVMDDAVLVSEDDRRRPQATVDAVRRRPRRE